MHRIAGGLVGAIGALSAIAITAGVARYAYLNSDTPMDGMIWATTFGLVSVLALTGPVLAVLLGRRGLAWGCVAWLIAAGAFAINVSNSFGAISGRSDRTIAERTQAIASAKDDRARLTRLERERAAMTFTAADADAVRAAEAAVRAAERTRAAECGNGDPKQRGLNCRLRETEEAAARNALSTTQANRALTDSAAKVDAEAASIRARLAKAPAFQNANPHGAALARLFHMADADTAASMQQIAMVTFVELAIAFMLAAAEKLLDAPAASRQAKRAEIAEDAKPTPFTETAVPAALSSNVVALIQPSKTGSVEAFMLACVTRAKGSTMTWAELYVRYRRWCAEHEPALAAMTAEEFGRRLDALRQEGVIRCRAKGADVLCLDTRLLDAPAAGRLGTMHRRA